ncbi:hypothetical protein ACQPVP_14205 [Clostridium nigeriense]|uniref:hypothetical protein n=1 Tax=Clostridium nigeriense TaxID=1805470 RepID=UPI003D32F905
MDNYLSDDTIKESVKEKLKLLYKDVVIDDIKEEVLKSKNEVIQNINEISENKKVNKEILNKLDQLLILVDMIENKEEKDLKSIAFNNKLLLTLNVIVSILIVISLFI